jgi:putative addiction module component (TIGR02574 family)
MTKSEIREEALSKLSPEERIELAFDLWDSLTPADVPVPEWHLEVLRERLAEDERDPDGAIPGEEVLARLRRPRE